MKKFMGIVLAAVCTLSAAAVGLSACEKKSEKVTAEEWAAAMLSSNVLNVTMDMDYSVTYKTTTGGVTATSGTSIDITVKTALSISGTTITGNAYLYGATTLTDGEESDSEIETQYETFTDSSYSYVLKSEYVTTEVNSETGVLETESSADWKGRLYQTDATPYDSEAYELINEIFTGYADMYDEFVYEKGAYKYCDEETPDTVMYVKINDGKLSSIAVEATETAVDGSYEYNAECTIKFSDYGKTTVTVPEQFTYEYYYLNYAS